METIVQTVINGLLTGGFYALLALGLTFVFGVMRIINFAHGELIMVGSYTTYWLFTKFGIDPFLSLIIVILVSGFVGFLMQNYLVKHVLEKPHLNQILLTFGISILISNSALFAFGANPYTISTSYSSGTIHLGTVSFGILRFLAFFIGILLTCGLHLFLKKTNLGTKLRAVSQGLDAAQIVGINVANIYIISFIISSVLAGIAGTISIMLMYVSPSVGFSFIIKAFAIVVLGGLGSIPGALVGALSFGVLESFIGTFVVNGSGWAEPLAFFVMIVILVVKPKGMFGVD